MTGRSLSAFFSSLLFPPRCALCSNPIPIGRALCGECLHHLLAVLPLHSSCPRCGKPKESCLCDGAPAFYSRCLSCFLYLPETKPLIKRLKEADSQITDALSALMLHRWREALLPPPDALTFVPAISDHYNQAEALALRLGEGLRTKVLSTPLLRHQNSKVQHTLSSEGRIKNAISSYVSAENLILSGRMLLIDDVVTTGATLNRCAQLLLQCGAEEVFCLTAATTPLRRSEAQSSMTG